MWSFHYREASEGQRYKYCVYSRRGVRTEKADPYAFGAEMPPRNASVLRTVSHHFSDESWMARRTGNHDRPLLIYEMHTGSWMHKAGRRYLSWREIAEALIPWLHRFHYTHVELMPIAEHPMDGSWGYQCTGFFAPTARHGTPDDFAAFVDALHREGFGVILDFVCVHFASDQCGLKLLDGGALYEPKKVSDRRSDWGSQMFDHGSGVVRSFLSSAAERWLRVFHIDGLRFDAVSHLLYRKGQPENGENTPGILFLQELNRGLHERHPDAMLIAEDSTLYPGTTTPLDSWGGLGFDYKWDMGWTYDAMRFMQTPPSARPGLSRLLTLGVDHARQARWMMVFSHDDAAWKNLYERMPGTEESRLRQSRLLLMFMMLQPGKKLLFMGTDQAADGSWSIHHGPDWLRDEKPGFLGFGFYCEDLFRLVNENSALHAADEADWSARWLMCDEGGSCVYALIRHSAEHHVLALMNFAAHRREASLSLPGASALSLLLHTDWIEYDGRTESRDRPFSLNGNDLRFSLPGYGGMLLEVTF